jgi:hypothetical protein
MAFSVSKLLDQYAEQDPVHVMRDGTIKSALIIFSFAILSSIFNLNDNLMVLNLLFIANLAASVLSGSIEIKRKVFIMYTVSAIFVMNVSTYVHPFFEKHFMYILPLVFLGFWVRRFGEAFNIFPVMLLVVTCICFIKFPLFDYNVVSFNIWSIFIAIAFYFVLIRKHKSIENKDIDYVITTFIQSFVTLYQETYEKSQFRKYTQTRVLERSQSKFENIISLQTHGLMILKNDQKDDWRYFCYNLILINRLLAKFVINYKKFSNNYKIWGFTSLSETKALSEEIQKLFLETLQLTLLVPSSQEQTWQKKVQYLEHLKYKFEMSYIEKYKNDTKKRNFLFSTILILDDVFVAIENSREAYNDFLKR